MSTIDTGLEALTRTRLRSLVWPREHGAWGILLVPLATGGCVGLLYEQCFALLLLFIVSAAAFFCLRTPFEVWLESTPLRANMDEERQAVVLSIVLYATVGGLATVALLLVGRGYGLLALGAVAVVTFLAQSLLRKIGRHMRFLAQSVGCIGLTSAAPTAYYVASGHLDSRACVLWALNWLFVVNQVHFVHLRIRTARAADRVAKFTRGQAFFVGELLTVLALVLGWRAGFLPGLATLTFMPLLVRGVIWALRKPSTFDVRRLGVSELLHALFFGALLIFSFAARHLQV